MTELRLDYEQKMRQEDSEMPTAVVLRSRREVEQKLIELGLARGLNDFGHHGRRTRCHGRVEYTQSETLDGDISEVKRLKSSLHGGRKRSGRQDSSPGFPCDIDGIFDDEVYQVG